MIRKICRFGNCHRLVDDGCHGFCKKHFLLLKKKKNEKSTLKYHGANELTIAKKKWYNRKLWSNLSMELKEEHPYCQRCYEDSGKAYFRPSYDLICDHIQPLESIIRRYVLTNNLHPKTNKDYLQIMDQLQAELTDKSNLQILCRRHHFEKHDRLGTYKKSKGAALKKDRNIYRHNR